MNICAWYSTFAIMHNVVLDSTYSMLLGRPWLIDAKVSYIGAVTCSYYPKE